MFYVTSDDQGNKLYIGSHDWSHIEVEALTDDDYIVRGIVEGYAVIVSHDEIGEMNAKLDDYIGTPISRYVENSEGFDVDNETYYLIRSVVGTLWNQIIGK